MKKRKLLNLKSIAVCALAATMAIGTVGCGSGGATSTVASQENGQVERIVTAGQPESGEYDPAGAAAFVYFDYQTYCLKGLIDYDENGGYVPASAEGWDISDDGLEYTFYLRDDVKWSDGSDVTSEDFKNTMVRALDPDKGSWYVDFLFVIKNAKAIFNGEASIDELGVECIDSKTLKITLESPCSYFLDLCKLPTYMPSNCKYATNDDEDWDMDPSKNLANGPYYMSEHVPGTSITYTKNEYYYDADDVNLLSVKELFMDDDNAKGAAYQTGEINMWIGAADSVAQLYNGQPDLTYTEVPQTNYILFNINEAPFDDIRVRQAFSLAVNRNDIATVVGAACSPSTSFVGKFYKSKVSGTPWGELQGDLLEENLEKAKELLKEAGYEDGNGLPAIKYTYPAMSYEANVAQVLQQQWEALGVEVELEAMEYEVYVDARRNGELQLCRMQWYADYNDPTSWLVMYQTGNAQNDIGWSNAEYDSLLEEADLQLDPAKREELLRSAEKIAVSDETIICPLFTNNYQNLIDPKIEGYTFDVLTYQDITKITLKEE